MKGIFTKLLSLFFVILTLTGCTLVNPELPVHVRHDHTMRKPLEARCLQSLTVAAEQMAFDKKFLAFEGQYPWRKSHKLIAKAQRNYEHGRYQQCILQSRLAYVYLKRTHWII